MAILLVCQHSLPLLLHTYFIIPLTLSFPGLSFPEWLREMGKGYMEEELKVPFPVALFPFLSSWSKGLGNNDNVQVLPLLGCNGDSSSLSRLVTLLKPPCFGFFISEMEIIIYISVEWQGI